MEDELARIRERWGFSEREPTIPAGHDLKALLEIVERIEAERDAAYRAISLADRSDWSPIVKAIWQRDHSAVIEAARKMGDE